MGGAGLPVSAHWRSHAGWPELRQVALYTSERLAGQGSYVVASTAARSYAPLPAVIRQVSVQPAVEDGDGARTSSAVGAGSVASERRGMPGPPGHSGCDWQAPVRRPVRSRRAPTVMHVTGLPDGAWPALAPFAGKACRSRHEALPGRVLDTLRSHPGGKFTHRNRNVALATFALFP